MRPGSPGPLFRSGCLFVALLAAAFFSSGCDRLPEEVRLAAKKSEQRLEAAAKEIEVKRQALTSRLASDRYGYLKPYAEREGWDQSFQAASRQLERASELFRDKVKPILDRNASEDAERAAAELQRVQHSLEKVLQELAKPFARADQLADAKERAPELVDEARSKRTQQAGELTSLEEKAERGAGDYPAKKDDLAGRLAAVAEKAAAAATAVAVAESQLADYERGDADLAELADSIGGAQGSLETAQEAIAELRDRIAQLYRSYAKTLVDMQEVYAVVVGRSSWNDYHDFPTEHTSRYEARKVERETLEYLDEWGDKAIYSYGSPRVSAKVWRELALSPGERLPRGDNAAELWVDSFEESYFHRYEYLEDETRRQGDWEKVSAAFYEQHAEDLGMDIVAKPYGMFDEEALREAAPPGMAFVGNPRYGQWESDGHGGRRWSWFESYLFYRLMFGRNHYYHYGDWNRWNTGYRGRRAYYGRRDDRNLYGTYGSHTRGSSRYASSTFGRSGGFKRERVSYRGSGPAGRGGGPGRRGK